MKIIIVATVKTINDLVTVSDGNLLLNARTVLRFLTLDQIPKKIIATVVVRIPPAVEEGAEPINIRTENSSNVPLES